MIQSPLRKITCAAICVFWCLDASYGFADYSGPAQSQHLRTTPSSTLVHAIQTIFMKDGYTPKDINIQAFTPLHGGALAEIELWPVSASGLFLVDFERKTENQIGYGLGDIASQANDFGGHKWLIREYEVDVPGYESHGYEAISIRKTPSGAFRVKSFPLATYVTDFESEQNLCSYFHAGEPVNLETQLEVEHPPGKSGDVISIRVTQMTCPDETKQEKTLRYLPRKMGFSLVEQANPDHLYLKKTYRAKQIGGARQ